MKPMTNKQREAVRLALRIGQWYESDPSDEQAGTAIRWVHSHLNNPFAEMDEMIVAMKYALRIKTEDAKEAEQGGQDAG
jgi:hypothetical protein